ncbi:5'-deoxynucleotidase HDDC2-like [Amphiura filiformis]|uniref:5'-deoxynucleotidase HDDC2-like n=1 Tax=Amphiura filiformis TaxID=82378 RepID=UPI003B21D6BF
MEKSTRAADLQSAQKSKREHETENVSASAKKTKSNYAVDHTVTDMRKIIEFMSLVGELKRVPRTGWVRNEVKEPESVSDHMYRMAVMSMLITPQESLDRNRCIKIALVHDMAECIVGDLTPWCGVPKEEKHKLEEAAMKRLSGLVSEETGKELFELWEEYEYQKSDEARFVKDLDRFEMILQAYEYEKQQKGNKGLQEFFESTKGKFKHPTVQSWVEGLHQVRNESAETSEQNSPSNNELKEDKVQESS